MRNKSGKRTPFLYFDPTIVQLEFEYENGQIKRIKWNEKEIDEKRLRMYMAMKYSGAQIEVLYKVLQIANWMQDEYENGRQKTLDENFNIDCNVIGIPDNLNWKTDIADCNTSCLDEAARAVLNLGVDHEYFDNNGDVTEWGGERIIVKYSVDAYEGNYTIQVTPNWSFFSTFKNEVKILKNCCSDVLYKEFSFEYPEKYQE